MSDQAPPDGSTLTNEEKPSLQWHALYHAALFETDRQMIPLRIAEAEKAILHRVKELFVVNTDHIEEDQVLDDALYAFARSSELRHAGSQCCLVDGFYWHGSSGARL